MTRNAEAGISGVNQDVHDVISSRRGSQYELIQPIGQHEHGRGLHIQFFRGCGRAAATPSGRSSNAKPASEGRGIEQKGDREAGSGEGKRGLRARVANELSYRKSAHALVPDWRTSWPGQDGPSGKPAVTFRRGAGALVEPFIFAYPVLLCTVRRQGTESARSQYAGQNKRDSSTIDP